MADFKEILLQEVAEHGNIETLSLAKRLQVDHQVLVGAVKSIQSIGEV